MSEEKLIRKEHREPRSFHEVMKETLMFDRGFTDDRLGKKPEDRTLQELIRTGVVNLDKPRGPTSHQVASFVRDMMGLSKAGQGGTLDPDVSGVLPIALEDSCRIMKTVLENRKEYVCVMRLGRPVNEKRVRDVLMSFEGPCFQTPPKEAAVKRQRRIRTIHKIDIHEVNDREVLFTMDCEAGTYVRVLVADVGTVLGVGAQMAELRRKRSGAFAEKDSVTLQDLKDAWIEATEGGDETELRTMVLPIESVLMQHPCVLVKDTAVDALCHGAPLTVSGIIRASPDMAPGVLVSVLTLKGEAVLVGEAMMTLKDMRKSGEGVAVKTIRVLMEPETYPRAWKRARRSV